MVMASSMRNTVPEVTGELDSTEVDSFPIWEVFTLKNADSVHIHAGSLSAPGVSFAQQFAREHYGQDQVCINIWIVLRDTFLSDESETDTYKLFVQSSAGDRHEFVGEVEARNGVEAKDKCRELFLGDKTAYSIWAAPNSKLTIIDRDNDIMWRDTTNQGYRLARGYRKRVRQKWKAIRATQAVYK